MSEIRSFIKALKKLPGIGEKSAERIVFFLLDKEKGNKIREEIKKALIEMENIKECKQCHNYTKDSLCSICNDTSREKDKILIVETPFDIEIIEESKIYNGLYHVLGGVLSPINGIDSSKLHIESLIRRVNRDVKEIIIATGTGTEGEATAIYLKDILKPYNVNVSRIATGVPKGMDITLTDRSTLKEAIKHRKNYED